MNIAIHTSNAAGASICASYCAMPAGRWPARSESNSGPANRPYSPQRYYVPPQAGQPQVPLPMPAPEPVPILKRAPSRASATQALAVREREEKLKSSQNVVVLSSPSGGAGVSTLAAMLAWELAQLYEKCALVDADLRAGGGGLDVLLGMEHEDGKRWHDIHAPLGMLDGPTLHRELPVWDGVRVLSFDPWQGNVPQPWEVESAVGALAEHESVVLVDADSEIVLDPAMPFVRAFHVLVVELSVLGLARAKSYLRALDSSMDANTGAHGEVIAVVGTDPAASARGRGQVSLDEAGQYLHQKLLGCVRTDSRLAGDLLEGLGIRAIPKKNRKLLRDLAQVVEESCSLEG